MSTQPISEAQPQKITRDVINHLNQFNPTLYPRVEQAAITLQAAGAEAVYLFGSLVEGRPHAASDIDLAVSGLPPHHFFQAMGEVMDILDYPFDLVDLDFASPFTRHLKESGRLYRVI